MKQSHISTLLVLFLFVILIVSFFYFDREEKETVNERDGGEDYLEYYSIAYSDVVSYIISGYKCHWNGFTPDEMKLSSVYGYESEYCGSAEMDINEDGVPELLIGDDFGDGYYQLYDIFTFDRKKGKLVHLLSGGERDYFVINSDGIVVEYGSNSTDESFCKYYKTDVETLSLEEIQKTSSENTMPLLFDRFMRYTVPTMYVAVKNGRVIGQLLKTFDESYLIESQDTVRIDKTGVDIQLWSAYDGRGVVYPTLPGNYMAFPLPDSTSTPPAEIIYEQGYCPPTYRCLGYKPGWFVIELNGMKAYLREESASWDFADRF